VSARVARVALVALIVGLALHNVVMALLWDAGLRDTALDVAAAWKDVLLLVALAAALAAAGTLPELGWADRLALAYGAIVVVYWFLPQSWLDGEASARGELYALRHHLLPLGAYALGRLLPLDRTWWRRIGLTLVGVGCALALWGLVDVYLVPLEEWRDSGVPGWFREQLGIAYECLSGLPENWILNTDEESPVRRLVSTFLSPLATAYALVVVALLLAAARPRRWTVAAGVVVAAGLLWTHTRAAFLALAAGLAVLAVLRRSWGHAALAGGTLAVSLAFVAVYLQRRFALGPGLAGTLIIAYGAGGLVYALLARRAVRRLGSAVIDLAYVACGRFDGYWELRLGAWDVAAGAVLVDEAGGRITGVDGGALDVDAPTLLATNGLIHDAMLATLEEIRRR